MPTSPTNPRVDPYFTDGCGRCPLGSTPECRVNKWPEELRELRRIALEVGLKEELKWGVPVYTAGKQNIVVLGAFKDYASINFFKGSVLKDEQRILIQPTENSQASRTVRFTDFRDVLALEPVLKAYIAEAVLAEEAGLKVTYKSTSEYEVPEEFQQKLDELPELKQAFEALTPGRQRGYLLHFAAPKQAKTRQARIEKYVGHILAGKGMFD